MLVITRKTLERIYCHWPTLPPMAITVIQIWGDKVRLGFDAPQDISILRDDAIKLDPPQRTKAPAKK
jgi:carbon storage regulator CsrA